MIEGLLELLGELVLQALVELCAEFGVRTLAEPFQRERNPIVAGFGYAIFGAAMGGGSLWLMDAHLPSPTWRVLNLIVTPVLVGFLMALLGAWRAHRGQNLIRLDRFLYGYLFALSFALVRFAAA